MNWMSILGLCLIMAGTVFSFFGTYTNDKQSQNELAINMQEKNEAIDNINASNTKLIDQNSSLLNSNKDISNANKNLVAQNKEMVDRIDKNQFDVEEKVKRIEQLQNEIHILKQYSTYAVLDIYGRNMKPLNGIKFNSDLSDRMNKILIEVNGKIFVKNNKSALTDIDDVIKLYPNFPFGYWAKFNLLKISGDNNCRQYAQEAINILKITTSIKGHDSSHDETLKFLKQAMVTSHQ